MSLTSNRARLEMLSRELARQWDETRESWRDSRAQEFDVKYMKELVGRVGRATTAVEKLEQLLAQVREDCE